MKNPIRRQMDRVFYLEANLDLNWMPSPDREFFSFSRGKCDATQRIPLAPKVHGELQSNSPGEKEFLFFPTASFKRFSATLSD